MSAQELDEIQKQLDNGNFDSIGDRQARGSLQAAVALASAQHSTACGVTCKVAKQLKIML